MNAPELNEMQVFLVKIQAEVDKIATKCTSTPPGSFTDKDADEVLKAVREVKSHIAAATTKLTGWQEGLGRPERATREPVPEKHGKNQGRHPEV